MAVSENGIDWSPITPLLGCAVHGERTTHHPVAGILRRKDEAHIYIHHNVPGVTADVTPSAKTQAEYRYLKLPPAELIRYSVQVEALRSWTLKSMDALRHEQNQK